MRDVEAGQAAGCRTILIADPSVDEESLPDHTPIASSLLEAVAMVERVDQHRAVEGSGASSRGRRSTHVLEANEKRSRSPGSNPHERPATDTASVGSTSETVRLLGEISDRLDRYQRQTRQHDFSVLRLFGALLQMFAVVVGVWGAIALLNDQHDPATARFVFACFLQLAAISAFAIDRFR